MKKGNLYTFVTSKTHLHFHTKLLMFPDPQWNHLHLRSLWKKKITGYKLKCNIFFNKKHNSLVISVGLLEFAFVWN